MKVYSWKTLLATILLGGGLAYALYSVYHGATVQNVTCVLILFGMAAVFSRALPGQIWVCLCFIIAAFVYAIWLGAVVNREIERDKAQQEE